MMYFSLSSICLFLYIFTSPPQLHPKNICVLRIAIVYYGLGVYVYYLLLSSKKPATEVLLSHFFAHKENTLNSKSKHTCFSRQVGFIIYKAFGTFCSRLL